MLLLKLTHQITDPLTFTWVRFRLPARLWYSRRGGQPLSADEARATRRHLASDYVAWLGFHGLYQQVLREHRDLGDYARSLPM